jgi:hypothetical protein
MKRSILLGMCILFASAMTANATIYIYVTETRSTYDSSLDLIEMHIATIVGSGVPAGDVLVAMLGTWTADDGTFNLAGTSRNWGAKLLNDYDSQDVAAPGTWLNFSALVSDTRVRTPDVSTPNSFYVGLYATSNVGAPYALGPIDFTPGDDGSGSPGEGFDNTLLGKFYVSKSTTHVTFSGTAAYCFPNGGGAVGGVPTTIFSFPEPSTLALLGCGVCGLLGYAWRKRK